MTNDRAAYTSGLRKLADLLDAHDEIPLPEFAGATGEYLSDRMTFYMLPYSRREDVAEVVRAFGGRHDKEFGSDTASFTGRIDGLNYAVTTYRSTVCERVVTGSREVTEEVPDPVALAAVPTTTVTRTVEDIEWVCAPLLAEVAQ